MRNAMISLIVGLALCAGPILPAHAQESADMDLAVVTAPTAMPLEDILGNRAKIGFTPVLTRGVSVRVRPGQIAWIRIRADLPERQAGDWVIRLPRVPLARVALQLPDDPDFAAQASAFGDSERPTIPGALRLPLPAGPAGPMTYYLRLEGAARAGIHPQLVTRASADAIDRAESWPERLAYLALLAIIGLAILRHRQSPRSGTLRLAAAAFGLLLALLATNGQLYTLPGGSRLAALGSHGLWVLWLLPVGPLLLAGAMFSGLMRSAPRLNDLLSSVGWAWPPLMLFGLLVPAGYADWLQLASWASWGVVAAASVLIVAMDSRVYRLGGLLVWMAVITMLSMRMLADLQVIEADRVALHAFEPMLVLLLASYLLMPWIRASMVNRAALRRTLASELNPEQQIDAARKQLMDSLQKGLGSALDGGDVQWIAFRRLLDGLKPVLKQSSSAVLAMDYHGEDLLQVEPRAAEDRYRLLRDQRANLLRSLSRSRAPQQVSVDFDGPDGPLQHVQLAAIPLPIDKPGWGLLLIEREKGVVYTDAELDLCAEFAALATTASDEAAVSVQERRAAEVDPETGMALRDKILRELNNQFDQVLHRIRPLTVMRLRLDNLAAARNGEGAEARLAVLHDVAKVIRGEIEYGESAGRYDDLEFLLVLPGKTTGLCRPMAERLQQQIARLPYQPALLPLIGMTEMRRGDFVHTALADRAGQAIEAARRSGAPASI